jgi:DNA-binding MarR family transcriptional regulator
LRESLTGAGSDRIGPRHRAVLAYLEPDGSRAIELARRCGQHKQVIGTLVDDLEKLGYVRREPDPNDRRAKLVVPTDLGLRQITKINDAMTEIERTMAHALGEQQYRQFKQSFAKVADLLSGRR